MGMNRDDDGECDDGALIDENNVISIRLSKPRDRQWELSTCNKTDRANSFPIIKLFDCDGNILIETNNDNISIKSSDLAKRRRTSDCSELGSTFSEFINGCNLTLKPVNNSDSLRESNDTDFDRCTTNSCKSSDTESSVAEPKHTFVTSKAGTLLISTPKKTPAFVRTRSNADKYITNLNTKVCFDQKLYEVIAPRPVKYRINQFQSSLYPKENELSKSKSLHTFPQIVQSTTEQIRPHNFDAGIARSQSEILYKKPTNRVSFLETYMRSLPQTRKSSDTPAWCKINPKKRKSVDLNSNQTRDAESPNQFFSLKYSKCQKGVESKVGNVLDMPSDEAAELVINQRLRQYRKGISLIEKRTNEVDKYHRTRRRSEGGESSSSESFHEADLVLSRLRRRILKNKQRERKTNKNSYPVRNRQKPNFHRDRCRSLTRSNAIAECNCQTCFANLNKRKESMGANLSHHTVKGLTGRRARSSGDLCNSDSKNQTDNSIYGSVIGDGVAWNRSLPNHLDSNRLQYNDDGSNNNYEIANGRYPNKRAVRYRPTPDGSTTAGPVWRLQDQCFDQGYGTERSQEDDIAESQKKAMFYNLQKLRQKFPFITEENTFTVLVEKDGRGLGMSVSGGSESGLVRIRRLYPPQPAWRTGQLAPRDIILAVNHIPLTGFTTHEALEVLRTAGSKVELLVCRSEDEPCDSPPHIPPPAPPRYISSDPLNCHPQHEKLKHTNSNTTNTSTEEQSFPYSSRNGSRNNLADNVSELKDVQPEGRKPTPKLTLPDGNHLAQNNCFGEIEITMTKVNGSLGFTLRKEDQSALGHYVRALIREPAINDGRIQPGDRIVSVNDVSMSEMSHAEAVAFLRSCGEHVRLRLYRDAAGDPLSPTDEQPEQKSNTNLRHEAKVMLNELATLRRTSSPNPSQSPRRTRLPNHKYGANSPLQKIDQSDGGIQSEEEKPKEPDYEVMVKEPISMPLTEVNDFNYKNPAYQSAIVWGENKDSFKKHEDKDSGLRKWKGVTLSPDIEKKVYFKDDNINDDIFMAKEDMDIIDEYKDQDSLINDEPKILTVELVRGWNSRLGFSIQSHPETGQSYISAVYSDSVAAKDGRLQRGDIILQVNDDDVSYMKTSDVIDLLRMIRGIICITVLRPGHT